jgi:RNA polymerase sigma-70 factor (ECF subfamily)
MLTAEMRTVEENNAGLLQRCRMNDPDACNQLFSLYTRRIFNTAYRILGEEASAEDALQETLLNVYRGLANFRGDSKISTWISRITVNVCLGMLRKSRNRQILNIDEEWAVDLPADVTPDSDPLEHTSMEELRSRIEETFRRMTAKQAVVVKMHDMEGHTIQEIAKVLGVPVGTIKSRLFYGRQEFKDTFTAILTGSLKHPTIQ